MFGYAAFAQAPFATLGGGVEFNRAITEASTATETVAALAVLNSSISVASTGTDVVAVAPSTFNATVLPFANAGETAVASAVFNLLATDVSYGLAVNSALIDFVSSVAEAGVATETVASLTDFVSAVDVLATILDSAIGGLLYEVPVLILPLPRKGTGHLYQLQPQSPTAMLPFKGLL